MISDGVPKSWIPYLDSEQKISQLCNADYGHLRVEPAKVKVGSKVMLTFLYTVGRKKIRKGGGLKIGIPFITWIRFGGVEPQLKDPKQDGFVSVDSDKCVEVRVEKEAWPWRKVYWIILTAKENAFEEGERIKVSVKNMLAPTFPIKREKFRLVIGNQPEPEEERNPLGLFKPQKEAANSPCIDIIPEQASHLKAVAPSRVYAGKPFTLKVAALDCYQNLASPIYEGSLRLESDYAGINLPANCRFTKGDRNIKIIPDITVNTDGICRIKAIANNLKGLSNPIQCLSGETEKNIYWGDIHGQGILSDGVGTPEEYYIFARDVSFMDVCALTDHDDGLIDPDVELTGESLDKWPVIIKAAEKFYIPGSFVTFSAYEWTSPVYGHHNVYYLNSKTSKIFSYLPGRDYSTVTLNELYQAVRGKDAMVIPHPHGPNKWKDWNSHDPDVEFLAEIYSDKGYSEETIIEGLNRGYCLGFTGSSDYHWNIPGRNYPFRKGDSSGDYKGGYVAVLATELKREAIWQALKERRCYATTGARIILDFSINGYPMGSKISSTRERHIRVNVIGTDRVSRIEIIKNGSILQAKDCSSENEEFVFTDKVKTSGHTDYYYARIKQGDGNFAWASPIWVT